MVEVSLNRCAYQRINSQAQLNKMTEPGAAFLYLPAF